MEYTEEDNDPSGSVSAKDSIAEIVGASERITIPPGSSFRLQRVPGGQGMVELLIDSSYGARLKLPLKELQNCGETSRSEMIIPGSPGWGKGGGFPEPWPLTGLNQPNISPRQVTFFQTPTSLGEC